MKLAWIVAAAAALVGCAGVPHGQDWVPIVDLKPDQANSDYWRDLVDCREYAAKTLTADQAAAQGALFGALLGAILSPRGLRNEGAGWGAAGGAGGAAVAANRNQESIVRNCLLGRQYRVLN